MNACAGMAIMMQTNMDMPWRGVVGIGGFAGISILALWVALRMKGKGALTIAD